MQISALIVLPLLVAMILVVTIIHFRKKKRIQKTTVDKKDPVEQLIDGTPDHLSYEEEEADYIQYDPTGLVKAYKNKLVYSHARYTALQRDHEKIQTAYRALFATSNPTLSISKKTSMENTNPLAAEKNTLEEQLDQLNKAFQQLERENASLTQQLGLLTGDDEEKAAIVNRWKEETAPMLDKIAEQDYLEDIIEEKKLQIEFLQHQLELRIQRFHQGENKITTLQSSINQLTDSAAAATTALQQKTEEQEQLQQLLNEKDELLTEKLNTITWLENSIQETRQQNEMLNAMAADNHDKILLLEEKLQQEETKWKQLEQKLTANRKMLKRLQLEISQCIEQDEPISPVVGLKAAYIQDKEDEWTGMVSQ